jgi:serine/threonine protein kinase/Tol biopolymer transport system component
MDNKPTDVESILVEALRRSDAEDRRAYLEETCGIDTWLRAEIDSLLHAYEDKASLLKAPPDLLEDPITALTEVPGTVIGHYKLLEKIGEGGMAVVYMAEQQEPICRKVALKIIKLGMDTKSVIARFEAERQALAMMDHPNIAKVLDAGATETGRPYFVMELVKGVSITDYCDANNLSTKERLTLFIQVCNAVQHAHQKGIIHRDIKPTNIMVTLHDGKPVPKVIDFGIAKAINQKLTEKTLFTRYAHIIGTPAYMSPEQAELSDLDIDTRTDIYSLGVLLYELLTGTPPFGEEELRKAGYLEMQRIIREQEPLKPSTKLTTLGGTLTDIAKHRSATPDVLTRTIRGDLDWIVMKSLEKDRARRYETANGLALDIQRHLEHEPVLARGPSTTYRIQKFLRRRRSQTVAALATLVVVGAVAIILSMWNRDRLQLDRTQALSHRGILSQAREQYAKAEREAALETIKPILDSRHVGPEAQLLYAGILVDARRSDEAATLLGNLLHERAEIAGAAHALLARIFYESTSLDSEKIKQMKEHRQKAEALLPETAEAYFQRAITAATIKGQLDALDNALQLESDHYESRRLRAYTYYASRKYDKIEHDAYAMTALWPRDPLGYSLRAIALRELGKYAEAIVEYNNALARTLKTDPQYMDLSAQRCGTLLRMGDYERVIADAQEYLKLSSCHPIFQNYLFCALTALGDYGKAEAVFHEIVGQTSTSRDEFWDWCAKYVFDTLEAGRSWHPAARIPAGAAFLSMLESEQTYRDLSAKAKRVIADAFSARWSPDGKKLAFSAGVHGYSGVAIFDLATKETDLLIVPGKDPVWSPDGKYIAFVRDRQNLRLEELATPETSREQRRLDHGAQPAQAADEEVWLMNPDGTEPRRLARGGSPSWGQDSTCVYYQSRVDKTFNSISIAYRDAKPRQIMKCSYGSPCISPDGRRVAYWENGFLRVKDLDSQGVVAEWPIPITPGAPGWSPIGDELCTGLYGGVWNTSVLWICRFDRPEPVKVLGGQVRIRSGSWAPDRTRLVLRLSPPYYEIWIADLDPNVSTIDALGPGQTLEEHYRDMVRLSTRRIEADPQDPNAYYRRARCYEYLHERANAEADMRRWSAVVSGKSPSDVPDTLPARAGFTFGEPVSLDAAIPSFFPNLNRFVSSLSLDGLEMFGMSDQGEGQGRFDIWALRRASPEDDWGPPENLGPAVNSASMDQGASISGDGLELYFFSDRPGGHGSADLYVTRRATRTSPWGPPTNLDPPVNSSYVEIGTSVSSDGLELYLSSDRPGGLRLLDIYVSKRATTSDPWGEPVNLGPAVNSPFPEYSPCLSPDGLLLLFTGYRPGGFGNFDLWMTRRASRTASWEQAVNLGPIINSPNADVGPCWAPDGSALYFAWDWSNRPGKPWKAPITPILDFNGDGKVDAADMAILEADWGKNQSLCDIGPFPWGDGNVDAQDLKVFMTYWQKAN